MPGVSWLGHHRRAGARKSWGWKHTLLLMQQEPAQPRRAFSLGLHFGSLVGQSVILLAPVAPPNGGKRQVSHVKSAALFVLCLCTKQPFLFCLLQRAGDDEGQGTGALPLCPGVFVIPSDDYCIMLTVFERLKMSWVRSR